MTERDTVYKDKQNPVTDFDFDATVVRVFPDMIQRSVPGYSEILTSIGMLSKIYITDDSNVYDLGCSRGGVSRVILDAAGDMNFQIIAVDTSGPMIEKMNHIFHREKQLDRMLIQQADICDIQLNKASFVVLNFTLQFVPVPKRLPLVEKIFNGMNKGAALILSEKIIFEKDKQEYLNQYHIMFKKFNGYSDLEISQKRSALDKIMNPEKIDDHFDRFRKVGFKTSYVWYQHFNFISMIAVK